MPSAIAHEGEGPQYILKGTGIISHMSNFQTNKAQLSSRKGPYTEEKLLEVESKLSRIETTETRKEKIIQV